MKCRKQFLFMKQVKYFASHWGLTKSTPVFWYPGLPEDTRIATVQLTSPVAVDNTIISLGTIFIKLLDPEHLLYKEMLRSQSTPGSTFQYCSSWFGHYTEVKKKLGLPQIIKTSSSVWQVAHFFSRLNYCLWTIRISIRNLEDLFF